MVQAGAAAGARSGVDRGSLDQSSPPKPDIGYEIRIGNVTIQAPALLGSLITTRALVKLVGKRCRRGDL